MSSLIDIVGNEELIRTANRKMRFLYKKLPIPVLLVRKDLRTRPLIALVDAYVRDIKSSKLGDENNYCIVASANSAASILNLENAKQREDKTVYLQHDGDISDLMDILDPTNRLKFQRNSIGLWAPNEMHRLIFPADYIYVEGEIPRAVLQLYNKGKVE